tara:strand:- start:931 stop:1065 length:135 start_codon:yes stop_codon:yes gene_type:complete
MRKQLIIDFIGMMILTTALIVFGTNAVTTEWNIWALMARFGGAL